MGSHRRLRFYGELTGAALRIPSNEERLACNDVRPGVELKVNARSWTQVRRRGAYGVFTMIALTVDTTAARRVAIENNFIAALYDGRFDVGRREEEGG